jgi:PPOX class probable F420-dependent enzyme
MAKLDAKVRKFLEGKNFAFLATANEDGTSHITPVWVDTDGEFVLVNTAVGRVKHRNVKRDPRVGISLVDQENPYKRVSLNGLVREEVVGKAAEDHIDHLAKKYTGASKYKKSNREEKRIIFKISVDRVFNMVA